MRTPPTYPAARRASAAAIAALLACVVLAGCGSDDDGSEHPPGDTLTVYTSLPRHGDSAREADAVGAGERLALADAHGRAGGRRVRLVELDSAEPDGASWDAATVQANAKRAADDPSAIAYIGELDAGGSAVSVPVTNDAGLAQISPLDGLTSLTRVAEGGPSTGPERYYPRGRRTFLRLVPNDLVQARALLVTARDRRAGTLAVVHDDRPVGRELTAGVVAQAPDLRIRLDDPEEVRDDPGSYDDLAKDLLEKRPDAVLYLGGAGDSAGPLIAALRRDQRNIGVIGSSGLAARSPLVEPGAILALDPVRPAADYGPRAVRILRRLERQRGAPVPPEALYGYESMRLVLDAIRTGGPDRTAVVRAALAQRTRHSAIGTYTLGPTGDVDTTRFSLYRRENGVLRPAGFVDPGRP